MNESKLISIYTLANRFEADLLMDALHREGVPAILRAFEETAYDGLFVPQRGWGQIKVPEEYISEAHEVMTPLIQDLQAGGFGEDSYEKVPSAWDELIEAAVRDLGHL